MSDHEIRTLLQGMAEDVQDVRPLGHKTLRRTRTRRWAVAATVVTSVMTIAVAGTGLALDAGPFSDESAVAPVAPGESTPPPPRDMPGTVVAYGTSEDGTEWWLSAYESETGKLCVDLQHDGRIAEDCSFYDPKGTGLGRDPEGDASPQNVFGWVPDDTDKAWVTWGAEVYMDEGPEDDAPEEEDDSEDGVARGSDQDDDGVATGSDQNEPGGALGPIDIRGDEEVRLFDAPEGFPFPVKFYALVPTPGGGHALRIEMNGGDATVLIFSMRPADFAEEPAGELVAEDDYMGYSWELYARTSGDERCLDLIWADEEFGVGGSCSTAVPRAESFQFSQLRFGDRHSQTVAFFAAMTGDVATMEMTLEEGETIGVEILEGPEGSEIDYAVEWPPPGEDGVLRGSVTSYDDAGNVLDTMQLCELSEPNSSCGSDSPPP